MWEFVDLALHPSSRYEELLLQQRGEVEIVQSVEQAQKQRKQIVDIFSWSKAFAIYRPALCSKETMMREVVGFWAHMHLITQLSRDLGGASGWRMTLSSGSGQQRKVSANGVRSTSQITASVCQTGLLTTHC